MVDRPAGNRFSRQQRLRRGAEFELVFNRRASASDGSLIVFARENSASTSRLGVSVSRKIGGAVVRNRWKRLLREAFRLSQPELPQGVDLVVIPKTSAPPSLTRLQAMLVALSARATKRFKRDTGAK